MGLKFDQFIQRYAIWSSATRHSAGQNFNIEYLCEFETEF
jgi:hypothetical protein